MYVKEVRALMEENDTLKIENESLREEIAELEYKVDSLSDENATLEEALVFDGMSKGQGSSTYTGPFVASVNRPKFHKPDCKWTEHIHELIRKEFSTREEAVAAGFKPCQTCCS